MKKLLTMIFLCTSALGAFADTKIIFLNGISGDTTKSLYSHIKTREILNLAGYKNKFSNVSIGHYYNSGDGFLEDTDELNVQSALSSIALTQAKKAVPSSQVGGEFYKTFLGKIYSDGITNGPSDSAVNIEASKRVFSVVKDFSDLLDFEIKQNNKIVVVAHSQGNFHSEAVNAYLRYGKSISEASIYDRNLRFVGVASVAASTPSAKYISLIEDKALNFHSSLTSPLSDFSILPRNANLCEFDIAVLACNISLSFIDKVVHGYIEIYTSSKLDITTNSSLRDRLAKLINESFDELNPPTSTTPTALTILQNGLYEFEDNPMSPCYRKSQLSQGTPTSFGESRYCLNNGTWQSIPLGYAALLLLPDYSWAPQALPQVSVTGNTTFDVKYGGQTLRQGTISLASTDATGSRYASVVKTPGAEYKLDGPMNINSVGELITTWNSSANGQAYLSRSILGWSFLGLATDLQNTAPLYDIMAGGCIPIPNTTSCRRNIVGYGTWERTTQGNRNETSEILKLNIPADKRGVASLASNQQLIYVKRSSQLSVEDGVYTEPGNILAYTSHDKASINSILAAKYYPPVLN